MACSFWVGISQELAQIGLLPVPVLCHPTDCLSCDRPVKKRNTHMSLYEFRKINVPDLKGDGECEQLDSSLIDLDSKIRNCSVISDLTNFKALFKVLIALKKRGIVDDYLCVCDAKLEDLVIYCLSRLDGADRFFKVHIERPEFQRFEESRLRGEGLYSVLLSTNMRLRKAQ